MAQLVEEMRYKLEIAGSIPNGVIVTFHGRNLSGQTVKAMSTRNISCRRGVYRRPVLKADNLTPSCENCLEIRERQTAGTLGVCTRPVQVLLYVFLLLFLFPSRLLQKGQASCYYHRFTWISMDAL